MNERVKQAAQNGLFEPFIEIVKGVVAKSENFDFDTNPYRNAYNLGQRDKANSLLAEIEDQIRFNLK